MQRMLSIKIPMLASLLSLLVFAQACQKQPDTTTVAAATGGALGAGLGAIIGNQTGDPGAGLVLGAIAGSGTGAAIGQVLESQDEAIRTQDEAMERQQRMIEMQQRELEELRAIDDASIGEQLDRELKKEQERLDELKREPEVYGRAQLKRSDSNIRPSRSGSVARGSFGSSMAGAERKTGAPVKEKTLMAPKETYKPLGSINNTEALQPRLPEFSESKSLGHSRSEALEQPALASGSKKDLHEPVEPRINDSVAASYPGVKEMGRGQVSEECAQAAGESQSAETAAEVADKLFHYRRALRLCPREPKYHVGLGQVYVSLKRFDDARFEFEEALEIDAAHAAARSALSDLAAKGY